MKNCFVSTCGRIPIIYYELGNINEDISVEEWACFKHQRELLLFIIQTASKYYYKSFVIGNLVRK